MILAEAKEATLRERLQAVRVAIRRTRRRGAAHQIATREPLTVEEAAHVVVYDAEAELEAALAPRADRASAPPYRLPAASVTVQP